MLIKHLVLWDVLRIGALTVKAADPYSDQQKAIRYYSFQQPVLLLLTRFKPSELSQPSSSLAFLSYRSSHLWNCCSHFLHELTAWDKI